MVAAFGVVAAWLPLGLLLWHGVWAPLVMTHETFGVHFTAPWMERHGYYFIRNAWGFTFAYTYLPNLLSALVPGLSMFDRADLYLKLLYGFQATVLSGLVLVIARSPLGLGEKVAIAFIGFTPYALTSRAVPALTINYHLLQAVAAMYVAYLYARWAGGQLRISRRLVIGLGSVAALAVLAKLTLLILVAPFCALLVISDGSVGCRLRRFAIFVVSGIVTAFAVMTLYHWGRVTDLPLWALDVWKLSTDPAWREQNNPALYRSVFGTVHPLSAAFGVQAVGMMAGLLMALLLVVGILRRNVTYLAIGSLLAGASVFCTWFLATRTAANTIVEAGVFAAFAATMAAAVLAQRRGFGWLPGLMAVAFLVLSYQTLMDSRRHDLTFPIFKRASEQARLIDTLTQRAPELPVKLYQGNYDTRLLYPSVPIAVLYSGEGPQLIDVWFRRYMPRIGWVEPSDTIREPHYAVVPEFKGEHDTMIWGADAIPVRRFGANYPNLDRMLAQNTCQTIDFRGWDRDSWVLVGGASHVTVCEVRTPSPNSSKSSRA